MKIQSIMLLWIATGCAQGGDGAVERHTTAAVTVAPIDLGDAPGCADIGGVPAGTTPTRIDGAARDLRAYISPQGTVDCVDLIQEDVSTDEPALSEDSSIGDSDAPSSRAPQTQMDEPTPFASESDCLICGKSPDPMDPIVD